MSSPDGATRERVARVAAQAKVNLRLRILAREASGYHQIETLFLRLALADDVVVRATSGARSLDAAGSVDARQLGPVERNLAWRAASAYSEVTGWPAGFAIELTKHIPVGGGLGGGSANAGAVLRALDARAPTPIG
jgi:4-diphosphocytidyl-2-C-methyl-D-erythritol kinase